MTSEDILQLLDDFKVAAVADERKNAKLLLLQHQQSCEVVCDLIQEKYTEQEVIEVLCQELLALYYRGGSSKCFCIQFLPVVIGTYLSAISNGNRKHCADFETLLLSIYNNEVSKQVTSENNVEEVRLPPLSTPSMYHKDPSLLLGGTTLIDNAVNRQRSNEPVVVKVGPYPTCASVNAENRFLILTRLWKQYNAYLNFVNPLTIAAMCRVCTKLCCSGFNFPESEFVHEIVTLDSMKSVLPPAVRRSHDWQQNQNSSRRIYLHPSFLLEMFNGLYFALYSASSATYLAMQAIDDLHQRASYELFPNVLLVTNAIINSLTQSAASPSDGPMGIRAVVAQPVGAEESSRRKLVTNASLRIKKLPDDIPLKMDGEHLNNSQTSLQRLQPVKESSSESDNRRQAGDMIVPVTKSKHLLFIDGSSLGMTKNAGIGSVAGGGLKESRSEFSMKDLLQKRASPQPPQNQDANNYRKKSSQILPAVGGENLNGVATFIDDEDEPESIRQNGPQTPGDNFTVGFKLKTPPVHRLNISVEPQLQQQGVGESSNRSETHF